MDKEIWKDIPGWEGFYQASTIGRIRSVDRILKKKSKNHEFYCKRKGKILKQRKNLGGYLSISLTGGSIKKHFLVHRLICLSFINKEINGLEVNHINFIRCDNNILNLEVVTAKQNTNHTIVNGRANKALGENSGASKLRNEEVLNIRLLYEKNTAISISKKYNLNISTIERIVQRKTWKHI